MHVFLSVDEFQRSSQTKPGRLVIDCREIIKSVEIATGTSPDERIKLFGGGLLLEDYLDSNQDCQAFFTASFKKILIFLSEDRLHAEISFFFSNRQHIALYFAERALDLMKYQKRKVSWQHNQMA